MKGYYEYRTFLMSFSQPTFKAYDGKPSEQTDMEHHAEGDGKH
jgi:hypothetical protein